MEKLKKEILENEKNKYFQKLKTSLYYLSKTQSIRNKSKITNLEKNKNQTYSEIILSFPKLQNEIAS